MPPAIYVRAKGSGERLGDDASAKNGCGDESLFIWGLRFEVGRMPGDRKPEISRRPSVPGAAWWFDQSRDQPPPWLTTDANSR